MSKNYIIALAKGRISKEGLDYLSKNNISVKPKDLKTRKLLLDTNHRDLKIIIVRSSDVAIYVHHGIADLGIVGKDILMEQNSVDYYELLDLGFCRCRLQLAHLPGVLVKDIDYLKIATKFVHSTKLWFAQKGRQVEIIKLHGAMELAATSGLADAIVDLVDTGQTLEANGLVTDEVIADISSRLIINKISYKNRNNRLSELLKMMGYDSN